MRWSVVNHYTGLFLKIFSALLLVPVAVGKYYGESFVILEPFLIASFISIVLGWFLGKIGEEKRPTSVEAMVTATFSWVLAVGIGALPIMTLADVSFIDAYFESMAGLTTTGMTILQTTDLPHSILFWRTFIQWIGGLGILTFFAAVLIGSGGVARKLVSTEANKASGGSIRPSLYNSVKAMAYVYILLTVLQSLLLYLFDFPAFHAVTHSLATLPTGGFSTVAHLERYMTPGVEATFIVFMFLGGTNFLLLYALLKGEVKRIIENFEFRLYTSFTFVLFALVAANLLFTSSTVFTESLRTSLFHAVSVLTSTGFELSPVRGFPDLSRFLFLIAMIIGGSLGSTTGGLKMMRFGIMAKLALQQIRSLGIPRTVVNKVSLDGRIVGDDEIRQVSAIFFLWLAAIFAGGLITVIFSPHSIINSIQLMASSVGTMGPTFITPEQLVALNPVVKICLMVGMLAGRLEMLPLLAIANVKLVQKFA